MGGCPAQLNSSPISKKLDLVPYAGKADLFLPLSMRIDLIIYGRS